MMISLLENVPSEVKASKPLDVDKAIEIIEKECKQALARFRENRLNMYRGYASQEHCLSIDPTTRERKGHRNLYNALTSILPSWDAYPQRSTSVMFSNSEGTSGIYGEHYWLFPYDGANIAHCEGNDCWFSFKYATGRLSTQHQDMSIDYLMGGFADLVSRSIKKPLAVNSYDDKTSKYYDKRKYTISDTQKFLYEMKRLTPWIVKHAQELASGKILSQALQIGIAKDIVANFQGDWIAYFDDLLDPVKNKMKRVQISDVVNIKDTVELWTDSKCVMVHVDADKTKASIGEPSIYGKMRAQI
jgi:hypothetical protein